MTTNEIKCPECQIEGWIEEEYPYYICGNCDHVWDLPEVAAARANPDQDKIAEAKLASGFFATHSPEAEEEAKAANQKWLNEQEAKAAKKITLTFLGGDKASYIEDGESKICQVNSSEHWQKMIEKAKANAQKSNKKLIVVNPDRSYNPYEANCPQDEYDYQRI